MRAELAVLVDADLLDRARGGDQMAATEFARRHTQWAIALAWRHGARDSSEDIVQELLAKLLAGDTQPILREPSARPYMHTAIIRRAQAVAEVLARSTGAPDDQWPHDQTSATGRLARAEDRHALHHSIATLPPYQREVVSLQLDGLDNAEISAETGHKPSVVRVYLSRAVASLRSVRRG